MSIFAGLLVLQLFQVLFLVLHDWAPLGALNDVRAVRAADSTAKLIFVTALSAAPFVVGLAASLRHAQGPYPGWLMIWLWVTYAGLLLGQLRAWWLPYLLRPDPGRAARYHAMFARTHAFLPVRNGMRPNTLHVILHASTLVTLLLLGALSLGRS
jgi:hypothetical protein